MVDSNELARLADRLVGFASALTGSVTEGEDLVADSLCALYPKRLAIDGPGAYAYFRQSILNRYRDKLGARRRHQDKLRLVVGGADHQAQLNLDLTLDVSRAVASLPADVRLIVVLRYLEDLSTTTVARMLGRPEGTVRRVASEGIAALRISGVLNDYLPPSKGDHDG